MKISAFKAIATYAFSLFVIKGASLLMLPVVTRYLTPTEYGQLELVTISSAFIALLTSCSLHEALYRFAAIKEGRDKSAAAEQMKMKKRAEQIFSLSLLLSCCLLVFLLLAGHVFQIAQWIQQVKLTLVDICIVAISLCIGGSLSIGLTWLRIINQVQSFTRISITTVLLQAVLVLSFLELGLGVTGVLLAGALTHCIQWCWVLKHTRLKLRLPAFVITKKLMAYAIPLGGSALIAFGLNGAERWLILDNSSLALLGQYSIASKFALATCILVQPFCMWWMPKRFALVACDLEKTQRFTLLGVIYIAALIIIVASMTLIFVPLVLTANYQTAVHLTLGTVFMILGKELTELINLGLLHQKQTQKIFKINIFTTFLGLAASLIFAKLGIWAIMISIGSAQLIKTYLVFDASEKAFPLFSQKKLLLIAPSIAILALIALFFTKSVLAITLISVTALAVLAWLAIRLVDKKRLTLSVFSHSA